MLTNGQGVPIFGAKGQYDAMHSDHRGIDYRVRPAHHLAMDPTLGWSALAKGEVKVRIVPGDHRSITIEPLGRQLAKMLTDELDAAQNGPSFGLVPVR